MEQNETGAPRHILICGARGVGKSTLINRLVAHCPQPIYGFVTKMAPMEPDGFQSLYIHPAGERARKRGMDNLIGRCNGQTPAARATYTAVFEGLGIQFLRAAPNGVIVMDELGFMEAGAPRFCQAVIECLAGDIPVIAAVKNREDVPFLNAVRACPKADVYVITEENRDGLYEMLLPSVQRWSGA